MRYDTKKKMAITPIIRRKDWGARELDVGKMGLVGWCLRKSKTAGVLL